MRHFDGFVKIANSLLGTGDACVWPSTVNCVGVRSHRIVHRNTNVTFDGHALIACSTRRYRIAHRNISPTFIETNSQNKRVNEIEKCLRYSIATQYSTFDLFSDFSRSPRISPICRIEWKRPVFPDRNFELVFVFGQWMNSICATRLSTPIRKQKRNRRRRGNKQSLHNRRRFTSFPFRCLVKICLLTSAAYSIRPKSKRLNKFHPKNATASRIPAYLHAHTHETGMELI